MLSSLVELIIAFVSKYIVLKCTYNFHLKLRIQSTRFLNQDIDERYVTSLMASIGIG